MAISGTSTDYSTRLKDIHIFQGVDVNQTTRITPSFGRISNYCSGIQKLVQRYTIMLLSTLGSQPDFPDFGSELLTNLNNTNSTVGVTRLTHIFNFANAKVLQNFWDYQRSLTTEVPADERLRTAVLDSIVTTVDAVTIRVKLYTMNAEAIEFLVPLPTTK